MNMQIAPVTTQLPAGYVTMSVGNVMDELEYRNYVSHRVRGISFERMEMWNFWNNIVALEERYQAALDNEQAIDGVLV